MRLSSCLPEIITRGCQEYTVGLDRSTLHQQHHIEQDAGVSERQQAVQHALKMGRTSEALPNRTA